jgi:hypothetical protein
MTPKHINDEMMFTDKHSLISKNPDIYHVSLKLNNKPSTMQRTVDEPKVLLSCLEVTALKHNHTLASTSSVSSNVDPPLNVNLPYSFYPS